MLSIPLVDFRFVATIASMKFVKTIYGLMKGSRLLYLVSLLVQVFMVFMTIFTSFLSKVLTDALTALGSGVPFIPDSILERIAADIITFGKGPDYLLDHMYILPIALIVSGVLAAGFSSLRVYLRVKASTQINKSMQMRLFSHLEKLPYPYYKTHKAGDLLQTCTRDLDVVRRFLMMEVGNMNYTLWMVGICFAVLLSIDWNYTLVCLTPFPFMFVYSFFLIKKVRRLYRKNDDSEAKMTDKISENLNAVRVVKAYHAEQMEIDSFEKRLADYRKTFIHWRKFSSFFFSSTDIFVFGAKALSLIYGVYLLYTGAITGGTLVVGISFVNMMVWPLRGVAMNLSNLGQVLASVDRMNLILEEPAEDIDSGEKPSLHGHIVFDHVSFTYPDSDTPTVNDLCFDLPAGKTLAIMGKTGSGKSTLTGLLTRLYDAQQGKITIDGIEITSIQKRHLRHNIVPVLQDPFLFSKSIEENILLGHPESSREMVYEAAEIASIHETIEHFPSGYQTTVGEKGVTLSGGQKQRLAIARTILGKPPVLIFDDSLSAVDMKTDLEIRSKLAKLAKGTTTILVTHRVMSAKDADLILVMDEGKIVSMGTHEQLIEQPGLYQEIYRIQSMIA